MNKDVTFQCFRVANELLADGSKLYGENFTVNQKIMESFEKWCDNIDRLATEFELPYEVTINDFGGVDVELRVESDEVPKDLFVNLLEDSKSVRFFQKDFNPEIISIEVTFGDVWFNGETNER